MKLLSFKLPETYLDGLDLLLLKGLYSSRSEAIRVAIRDFLKWESTSFSIIDKLLHKAEEKEGIQVRSSYMHQKTSNRPSHQTKA
jgi:antitoxin ParD1/3/4